MLPGQSTDNSQVPAKHGGIACRAQLRRHGLHGRLLAALPGPPHARCASIHNSGSPHKSIATPCKYAAAPAGRRHFEPRAGAAGWARQLAASTGIGPAQLAGMSGGSGSRPPSAASAAASAASGRAPSPNGAAHALHPRPDSAGSETEPWSTAGGSHALPALRSGRRRVSSMDPFPRCGRLRPAAAHACCCCLLFQGPAYCHHLVKHLPLRLSCRDAHAEGLLLGSPHDSAAGQDPRLAGGPLDSPHRSGPASWRACLMQVGSGA